MVADTQDTGDTAEVPETGTASPSASSTGASAKNSFRDLLDQFYGRGTEGTISRIVGAREVVRLSRPGGNAITFGDPDASWDWRSASVDREGRKLPPGAVGWTPSGDPYYGSGKPFAPSQLRTVQGRLGIVAGPITNEFTEWAYGIKNRWDWYRPNDRPPTPLQRAGQIAKEALTGFGEGWNAIFALPIETGIGLQQGAQEAGEGSPLPDVEEAIRKNVPRGWFTEYVLNLNPILQAYNMARLAVAPGTFEEKRSRVLANTAAARIAYSSWKDPALRQEYLRRFEEGEDPYLLARELRRPWAEMWGTLILDPTNAIMLAGWMGKFGKSSIATHDIARSLGATDDILREINALKNAGTETQAIEAGERLVQASIDGTRLATEEAAKLARGRNVASVTTGAARELAAEEAGNLAQALFAHHHQDPEAAIEVLRLLAQKSSQNADEVMGAVGELSRHPFAPYLFSEQGNRVGILVRRLLSNADGALDPDAFMTAVKKVQDDPAELLKLVNSRMEGASQKLYPTVAERIAAGEDVPRYMRELEKLSQGRGPIGTINRYFAGVYMGLSPGYAVRNALTNAVHMFFDYGPGTFQRTPATAAELTTKWLGGVHPAALTRSLTPATLVGASRSRLPFTRLSNWFEGAASRMIYGNAVERTMRSALVPGRGLPDIRPLVDAGLSPEAVRYVVAEVVGNYGDTRAAEKAIRTAMSVGAADSFRSLEFLRPSEIKFLQNMPAGGTSLYDRLLTILKKDRSATSEDALKQIQELFADFEKEAQHAAGQALSFEGNDLATRPLFSAMVQAEAQSAGLTAKEAQELVAIREFVGGRAMSLAQESLQSELGKLIPLIQESGGDPQLGAVVQDVYQLQNGVSNRMAQLQTAADKLRQQAGLAYRNVKAGTPEAEAIWAKWGDEMSSLYREVHQATLSDIADYLDNIASVIPDYDASALGRAREALQQAALWDNATVEADKFVSAGVDLARPYTGGVPSQAQFLQETAGTRRAVQTAIEKGLTDHWGEQVAVTPADEALVSWLRSADDRIAQARLMAMKVADSARDFTLLNYTKRRGVDTVMGLLFPYQYWYSRTYLNWMRRLVKDPEILGNYMKYRRGLEDAHAGAPDWWKYNINTNELLGMDSENPLYFNLEATLNPLNGITGVDFDNADRRQGWFANTVDDLGHFGPSIWTPLSLGIAVAMYMKGEKDSAAAWAGRLIPQTASVKAGLAVLRGKVSDLPLQGEYDPAVHLFSGGMDPYERRRVARALGGMIQDGTIDVDTAADTARTQSGPYWNQAIDRAITQRAPGQLFSFAFGTGFKPRTPADMQTDQFYSDYSRLLQMEGNLSPDEWRTSWDNLRAAYPFMDAMLLARKDDFERDRAFAYNVMSRIPPSQQDDYADLAGIDRELLSQFHDSKGHMEEWNEGDRLRFMSGMIDLGAVLRSPADATRAEWTKAKSMYDAIYRRGEATYGRDIWERVSTYYGAKGPTDEEKARAERILEGDPEIGSALDFKSREILTNPLVFQYYASLNTIEGYYNGQMWGDIERKLGSDIWDKWDEYYRQEGAEKRAYWNAHPELEQYRQLRAGWEPIVAQRTVDAGAKLRDVPPELRRGELGLGQQDLAAGLEAQNRGLPQISWDDWQDVLGTSLSRLVADYALHQDQLPGSAIRSLEDAGAEFGIENPYLVLELASQAIQQVENIDY